MISAGWFSSLAAWRLLGLYFVPIFALLNVAWEIAQLPLYTLWNTGSVRDIAFSVAHCSLGDALIGTIALMLALILTRSRAPATWNLVALIVITTLIGIGYTIFSEWMNTRWLQSWAYSDAMPILPVLGTGLAPLLQWLLLPGAGLVLSLRAARRIG